MRKKVLLLALLVALSFGIVACGGGETAKDTEKPVISGTRDITYVIGESATPNYSTGVTAFDNLDGNITSKITVDSSAVNLQVPGTYSVKYSVTDLSGNKQEVTITVTVKDETAPVFAGVVGLQYVIGDPAPLYAAGVTATDNVDGVLTSAIVVDSSAVNLEAVGVYVVKFTVEDAAGNEAEASTFIQVKLHADDADLVPPIITGYKNWTYVVDESTVPDYLLGVVATDGVDGNVTASLAFDDSEVDYEVAGTYFVYITAKDSEDNEATIQIAVVVSYETVAPVLSGIRSIEAYIGEVPKYLQGLVYSDNVDTVEQLTVKVDSTKVPKDAQNRATTAGTYEITITVTDRRGNFVSAKTNVVVSINPINAVPDLDATYRTYTSGTDNLNPYSETLATASELFGYITDSLYTGDFDWAAARAVLVAEDPAKDATLPATIGFTEWYAAGKPSSELPYNRFPAMAASAPVALDEEGIKWSITLRDDLAFEDGTPITASTFDYSWRMLLDPKLLNDRASNLYANTDLPLVGAEAYFKQNSPDKDEYGFIMYTVAGVQYARANAYFGKTVGNWDIYHVENKYLNLIGPDGIKAYVEYWGGTSGLNGWVLETQADEYFMIGSDDKLYAPTAGWTLNGVVVPHEKPAGVTNKAYAGAYPAYMDAAGNRAVTDDKGIPVNGVQTYDQAVLVEWSQVGFKVVDSQGNELSEGQAGFDSSLTFEITLSAGKTQWDVMGALSSGIVGVVHEASFEAGMNVGRTQTTYGTIDNPLVSYGPYNLVYWGSGVQYVYEINPDHYAAEDYRIRRILYNVIEDQSLAVEEFKAGRLDVVGAGGQYYNEFKYNKNLRLSPTSTFFRFAFNIDTRPGETAPNPILKYSEFRTAFYYAIDRVEFSSEVRAPSLPTQSFLGPLYLSTEYSGLSYRSSLPGLAVLEEFSPTTVGFDPVKAKTLFDQAYAKAVAAGEIQDGDKVAVEYTFYNVETNVQVANWVKSTVEAIFNAGSATPKFELKLDAVTDAELDTAWETFDFDMTFGGWRGLTFDAPSMLGQVYNSNDVNMLEKGFNTADAVVEVSLPNTKVALASWIAGFETKYAEYIADQIAGTPVPSPTQIDSYEKWKAVYALFEGDVLTTTYDKLFKYAYKEFYNVNDINYAGKTDDFDAITAALEGVLMEQMIAIPLMTTVATTVYNVRVVIESDSYHAWMGWGGFKYMYIGTAAA